MKTIEVPPKPYRPTPDDIQELKEAVGYQPSRKTIFSPCRAYRYTLWRDWDCDSLTGCADDLPNINKYAMFIGLNPSTADETNDDPTIRRCINFAKSWGYGALCMTNLFAFRATDPVVMKKAQFPVGEENDRWLSSLSGNAGLVLAAWGNHGAHGGREKQVRAILEKSGVTLMCLGKNRDGSPKHPLYIASKTQPVRL